MNYKSFKEVDNEVLKLYNEQRYDEAVSLLDNVKDKYPDDLFTITWDMTMFYLLMEPKKVNECLDILEYGFDKGLFYSINPDFGIFEALKGNERFNEFVVKNNNRLSEIQEKTKAEYKVQLPKDYNKSLKYPLHIAIHGGGESIEFFKPYWNSEVLDNEYITLFVQASKVVSSIGYSWFKDLALSKKEIKNAYEEVINNYSIDLDNITIGGFSEGGTLAVDLILNDIIPSKGFISLCPDKPEDFSNEVVKKMNEKGKKGVILTGEMDQALPQQKEMVNVFEEIGFVNKFVINSKLGHWFPENISEQINEALDFINK